MKSKTFKCFATNAANSYARADVRETLKKKRKEKEKERERKKQKIPHSEVVQNVSFFGISTDSINFISVQESIRDSDFESVGREEEKKMGEEEDRSLYVYMCVCVCGKSELRHLLRDGN